MQRLIETLKSVLRTRWPRLVPPLKGVRDAALSLQRRLLRVVEGLPIVASALRSLRATLEAGRLDPRNLPAAGWLRSLAHDRGERRRVFQQIFHENRWGDEDSHSGMGSNLEYTETLRAELPRLVQEFGFRSMADIPCGDFFWMRLLFLDLDYFGGDIVPELIERNRRMYGGPRHHFAQVDIVRDPLPEADLLLCRDCLVHLSYEDAFRALANIKRSGSAYLLTTTYWDRQSNRDITTGDWRTLNLLLPPFSLGPPIRLIDERAPQEGFRDKGLGLWKIADLPTLGPARIITGPRAVARG
jgi:hypothetical protein